VRRALLIAVVVLVLVTGLPVLMSMGDMAACDYCGPGVLLAGMCLVALAAAAVAVPELLRARFRLLGRSMRLALFATLFERPPQLV
jgi:hypothetical protein